MMKIGTSGFRGVIGDDFTKDQINKIAQCTCEILRQKNLKKEIVLGFDNRFMSDIFAKWFCEVLIANGVLVKFISKPVLSPLISFATKIYGLDLGIMITASHNPYYYNGIKIFSKNGVDLESFIEKMYSKLLTTIKKIKILDFDEGLYEKKIVEVDLIQEYVSSIVSLLKIKKDYKTRAIFNVMNGSSLSSIIELKNRLGLKNLELFNTERDVLFGLGSPNPSSAEVLKEFKNYALKNKFDFAFATDADGDRLALFDEKGEFHNGNEIACLIYDFALLHKKQRGGFVKNNSFSIMADMLTNYWNTKLYKTPVGFKYISQALIKNDALIGAENSGLEVNGHVYTKDGLVAFALILEIVEFYKKPLSQIIDDLKQKIGYNMVYREESFFIKNKKKAILKLKTTLPKFSKRVVKKDFSSNFKYIFEDNSWVLIRISGTENLFRIVGEQFLEKELNEVINISKEFLSS